jgi:hypothetical protein
MKPIFLVYTFQDAEHLRELLAVLEPHRVLVHVDAKAEVQEFASVVDEYSNVTLTERVQVNWGGYSQVRAIRILVREALRVADDDDYLVMLSGSDYPLRPVADLVEHLRANQGRQYLRAFEVAKSEPKYFWQVDRTHHRDMRFLSRRTGNKLLRKLRNGLIRLLDGPLSRKRVPTVPRGLTIAHGGTHFAVTAECMRSMEGLVTPEVERYFASVFCPEEKFYQSLITRTPFVHSTPAGGLEEYTGPGNWRYANLHLIDPTLIRVFTIHDWPEIETSEKFFIRKMVSGKSDGLREKIKLERLQS